MFIIPLGENETSTPFGNPVCINAFGNFMFNAKASTIA